MAEIGETLREARMRGRIDMTEVERATKIRGKYLRALENEEWDLLPGTTYVKSFLRTYAEYLGLDARMLVEEYRQRYEGASTQDLTPFAPARGRGRARRRRLAPLGPVLVLASGAVLLLAALWALGTWGSDDEMPAGSNRVGGSTPAPSGGGGGGARREKRGPRRPRRVRVQLVATGPVYVCLVDASGRQRIDEQTLTAGSRTRTFRGRSFRTNFGNANLRMKVNGKTYAVKPSTDPVGYSLRPGRRPKLLSDAARPDCSS
jgi:cytoskeleton protein RodZ